MRRAILASLSAVVLAAAASSCPAGQPGANAAEKQLLSRLDAPLLFVKRHSYKGIHIYDTFYKWPPGAGGIYILENPSAPRDQWRFRTVIDEASANSLGKGVYSQPELSWDAKRLLFCFKGEPKGSTKIYEIGVDGTGLRLVSDPSPTLPCYKGAHGGQHDVDPAYLPDGRIVFTSTRQAGLVPCANSGVAILHVMNADGGDIRPISVNAETEFDPAVLPDGRIVYGRWEYVDKNALTMQSLWTVNPDGTNETALFANNMVLPEACLDVRPVPGSHLVATTLAKHNSTPRGSIAMIDPLVGKNGPAAICNFENPDNPTHDRGESCEPWPLDANTVLFSGRPAGQKRNVIDMITREGTRITVLADANICLHSPMLVKPRPRPRRLPEMPNHGLATGEFYVQDVYEGLVGIDRGEARWLRVIEETSRVSHTPRSSNPYNQTFLVSGALAFATKIYHGVVPVEDDGSVYFQAPSGRALYFQVLDKDKRLIQSMRTFIQAAPGTTRSCIGCHEFKFKAPGYAAPQHGRRAVTLRPESWGTGYMDYPSMIQPIWDKHCVSCHGGEKGFAGRLDLTGGWTAHFNNSYVNLADRRETQLVAHLISGIDCMNGTAFWSGQAFKPRAHGSATAPLAKVVLSGHDGRIPDLTARERDLIFAWIESNGLYYGTWNYTRYGYHLAAWNQTAAKLRKQMTAAGCDRCHPGKQIGNDWVNLQKPERSRILRAPLAKGGGLGAAICRDHPMDPKRARARLLRDGRYQHAVRPLKAFAPQPMPKIQPGGKPRPTFASADNPHYQAMLAIIRSGRAAALATPRVDMPGATIIPGKDRMFIPPPVPKKTPYLLAELIPPVTGAAAGKPGGIRLSWERSARTIGLEAEIHRGKAKGFAPGEKTLLTRTPLFHYVDAAPPADAAGWYAVILTDGKTRSEPAYVPAVNLHLAADSPAR